LIKVDGQNSGLGNIIRAIGTNSNLGADIEAFTVRNDGKVGIGTATPVAKLQVAYNGGHTSGNAALANSSLDLYNPLAANTDEKGSILTFSDNYFDGSNYPRTTRAAIKGGTDFVGNDARGFLSFFTNSSSANTLSEKMRVTNTGNVGIGTTNPQQTLQVDGNIRINHLDLGGAPADTAVMEMYGYEGRGVGIRLRDSVNSASSASNREWFVGTGYNTSSFGIGYSSDGSQSSYNNQNKLTVGANGDVGVGTTGPQGKLHVEVSEGNAGFMVGSSSSTDTNSRYQVITCTNVLATSGTWYDVAYVTHSPTIDVLGRILANNAASQGGAGTVYHVLGMYGSVTAHQKTYQLYNNTSTFTNFEYRYLNGGASSGSYRLQVRGTWTNSGHNAYVYTTIRGMADGTMYEDD
jgi:hypothetical protein